MASSYHFYTTSACHLCEDAANLLTQHLNPHDYLEIEISTDDKLIKDYGTRIPVIKSVNTHQELAWPFNAHELVLFIQKNSQ